MAIAQAFAVLDKQLHDLKAFDCGKETMNLFLSRYALKHNKQGLSRTVVLSADCQDSKKQRILAYYTLAGSTITRETVPASSSLPRYPIPVILLARLAVDRRYQGQGLGEKTLVSALQNAQQLNQRGLPAYGVVLDVLDDDAMGFYEKFEFFKLTHSKERKLFVSMQTLNQLFGLG